MKLKIMKKPNLFFLYVEKNQGNERKNEFVWMALLFLKKIIQNLQKKFKPTDEDATQIKIAISNCPFKST